MTTLGALVIRSTRIEITHTSNSTNSHPFMHDSKPDTWLSLHTLNINDSVLHRPVLPIIATLEHPILNAVFPPLLLRCVIWL